MPYFTSLTFGEPHEPKLLLCAHHSYNLNAKGKAVINIFEHTAEKQETVNGEFKPVKFSADAVKLRIQAHLHVFGIDNSRTEKI